MIRSNRLSDRAGARVTVGAACSAAVLLACAGAFAGGGPENALLVIDPTNPSSLHVGNHYKTARNIPDSNVLYMSSTAAPDYRTWVATNQAAFLDALAQRGIDSHIDYVVVAPANSFFVPASGLVTDTCSPVNRFSVGTAYGLAHISGEILAGGNTIAMPNRYYSNTDSPQAFESSSAYLNGVPSGAKMARRYFIGGLLGHVGPQGNTVAQIIANIDRSVAVDGTRPGANGTFYFMNTTDVARNVRAPQFATVLTSIPQRGSTAQQLNGVLPPAGSNCLGIMTGIDYLDIGGSGINILPGSFCDHLTSYAATFDIAAQTKVSTWIARGASGSAGTVEEPCNYTGKFPHARLHVWYLAGLSMGEAYFRSMQSVPFQNLFYGDPLTRAHAHIPVISVPDGPTGGQVSGVIQLTPSGTTTLITTSVRTFDMLVDGALIQGVDAGGRFTLDTTQFDDGYHDLRVLGRDGSFMKMQGRWTSSFISNNYGRSATLQVVNPDGPLTQIFQFNFGAAGPGVSEVRLLQGGRVIAASAADSGSFSLPGHTLGAGVSQIQAEAIFADGRRARSVPVSVNVAATGANAGTTPHAFSYSKFMLTPTAHLVEFPGSLARSPADVTFTLLSTPSQATVLNPNYTGPYRIIRPHEGAKGSEQIRFQITHGATGTSNVGIITLVYSAPDTVECPPDWNEDGSLNSQDFFDFLTSFFAGNADYNDDAVTNSQDFFDYLNAFFGGC